MYLFLGVRTPFPLEVTWRMAGASLNYTLVLWCRAVTFSRSRSTVVNESGATASKSFTTHGQGWACFPWVPGAHAPYLHSADPLHFPGSGLLWQLTNLQAGTSAGFRPGCCKHNMEGVVRGSGKKHPGHVQDNAGETQESLLHQKLFSIGGLFRDFLLPSWKQHLTMMP